MKTLTSILAVAAITAGGAAYAQSTSTPATKEPATTPPATAPATPRATMPDANKGRSLTDAEAKAMINKAVYSSDEKNVGEVAAIQRDATGKVSELHVDIGGFLGLGETRVKVMPSQFKVENDRIVLNLTSEETKALPKISK